MANPVGVKIPISLGNTGYFNQTFSSLEEAKSNMYNLLLTRKGERVMHPDFGTNIYNYLFEQTTVDLANKIENEIEDAVEMWLPYIQLQNVEVDVSNENIDNNKFSIKIGFNLLRDLEQYDEIIILFEI